MNIFQFISWKKKDLPAILLLSFFYFVSGKLGLNFASVNPSASPIWPPTGIALAAFLLLGLRVWPAIFIGAFFANITTAGNVATSLAIAFGNTMEGLVGAYLINTYIPLPKLFSTPLNVFKYTILAALIPTIISASIGVSSLYIFGFVMEQNFLSVWLTWWLGDASGALVVAPLILLWVTNLKITWNIRKILELVVVFMLLLMMGDLVFGGVLPYPYLTLPITVWIALRFSQKTASAAILLLTGIAIVHTLLGNGPFAQTLRNPNESLLLMQLFLGTLSVTTLVVSSIVFERNSVETALKVSELRFRALIEKSSEAIALANKHNIITYITPSVSRVLGYAPSEMVGKNGLDFIHPDDLPKITSMLAKLIDHLGSSVVIEVRVKHKSGNWRWFQSSVTNLLEDPYVRSIVSNFHDVTEQKEIDQAKSEFVSLASHQLRTPASAIKWLIELLMKNPKTALSSKERQYLQDIYHASERMIALVNSLLNVQRLELGMFQVEPEKVSVEKIIDQVLSSLKPDIQNKKLLIEKIGDENLPEIEVDPKVLAIVLQNLLSNAVRYSTENGKIEIHLQKDQEENKFHFSVSDAGCGIPDNQQDKIFTKLFRADNIRNKYPDGTGLGLYMVKLILEKLGGSISFKSKENKGTTFFVTLPIDGKKKQSLVVNV